MDGFSAGRVCAQDFTKVLPAGIPDCADDEHTRRVVLSSVQYEEANNYSYVVSNDEYQIS
jgi:hypothetical protein